MFKWSDHCWASILISQLFLYEPDFCLPLVFTPVDLVLLSQGEHLSVTKPFHTMSWDTEVRVVAKVLKNFWSEQPDRVSCSELTTHNSALILFPAKKTIWFWSWRYCAQFFGLRKTRQWEINNKTNVPKPVCLWIAGSLWTWLTPQLLEWRSKWRLLN